MSDLKELYREVILDHNKHPRNFKELKGANCHAEGFNPLCGDKLTIYVNLDGDIIADISFLGSGCAISKASASLMTDAVKGKTLSEAQQLFREFHQMVTTDEPTVDEPGLGKLKALSGVHDYPTRIKCASLAWHTLRAAFNNTHEIVSTE